MSRKMELSFIELEKTVMRKFEGENQGWVLNIWFEISIRYPSGDVE